MRQKIFETTISPLLCTARQNIGTTRGRAFSWSPLTCLSERGFHNVKETSRGKIGGRLEGRGTIPPFQIRRVSGVNLSRKRLSNISLSCSERSVILGGLLGDGSLKIYPGYKNARFSFRHSEKQSAYFFHKVDLLSGIKSPGSVQRQGADGWSSLGKLAYQSRALPTLTEIHNVTHKNNRLQVRRKWLNHLTAHSLAIWWFDDGSIVGGGRRGVLCTDGLSEAECLILARYLLVVWKIRARVAPVSKRDTKGSRYQEIVSMQTEGIPCLQERNYYRLWLSTRELSSFLRIILPYLPCKEMFYKVLLNYKDPRFQERWISEVERGCPQDLKPFLASSLREMKKKDSENDIVHPLQEQK